MTRAELENVTGLSGGELYGLLTKCAFELTDSYAKLGDELLLKHAKELQTLGSRLSRVAFQVK